MERDLDKKRRMKILTAAEGIKGADTHRKGISP